MSFPLVEYRAWPRGSVPADVAWDGVLMVDLRHVSAAHPAEWGAGRCSTSIALAGMSQWHTIDVPYEDFVRDWKRAKGL